MINKNRKIRVLQHQSAPSLNCHYLLSEAIESLWFHVNGKHVVVTIIEHIVYQSQPSPSNNYTYEETLEGLRCCEILESIQTNSICGWWIQISTLQNHSLCSWWKNGRVEMLWITQISPNSLNLGLKSGIQARQLWPLTPPVTGKHVVVTINIEPTLQA